MRHILTLTAVFAILSGIIFAPSAYADKEFECFAWTSAVSRSLFGSTGTYGTTGPALLNVTECAHTGTGIYGQVFLSAPLKKFNDGDEVDLQAGYRPKLPWLDVDVSAAWYYFGIGDAGTLQTLDVRVRVAHTFPISSGTKLELYGISDYQHSSSGTDQLGLATGFALAVDLPVPGTPKLGLKGELWNYPLTPHPGRGPIGSITADLGFKIPGTAGVVIGPRAQLTVGDVDKRHSADIKKSFGIFVLVPFGF